MKKLALTILVLLVICVALGMTGCATPKQLSNKAAAYYPKQLSNKAAAYYLNGISYGESGQYQKAILPLKKAIQINPDYVEAYYWLGYCYEKLGYNDEAIVYYKEVLRIDPEFRVFVNPHVSESARKKLDEIQGKIVRRPSPPPTQQTPQPSVKQQVVSGGTGFLFSSQDYIVTNYHVVKGTSEVKVKFTNGESINAEVIARDTQNDIAVLKLTKSPSFQSREMKFGDSSMVRMGDKVFTIGYPHIGIMGLNPKYTEGVISAVTGIKDNPTVFQTTVPIQPGNSGGPLFNDKGEVVGLTTSSLSLLAIESMGAIPQSVNYAVKSSFVKNTISTIPEALLSNRGIVVVPTDSNSRSDFIEAISKNVVLILGKVD